MYGFPFLESHLFSSSLPALSRKRYVYGQEGAMKRRHALTSRERDESVLVSVNSPSTYSSVNEYVASARVAVI